MNYALVTAVPVLIIFGVLTAYAQELDSDGDGIADKVENILSLKYAPEVRLAPNDRAKPANVEWYLERVTLRFDHGTTDGEGACAKDDEILSTNNITQMNFQNSNIN